MAGVSETGPEARLLVVEDEPNILELLSASLRLAGFEVATATGGLEALAEEVVARIRAVLRRASSGGPPPPPIRLRAADLELDTESHEVWRAGRRVQLSPTEFKLLRYLMTNAGRVLSKNGCCPRTRSSTTSGTTTSGATPASSSRTCPTCAARSTRSSRG
jgi:DNA-binding response OmpR family regulator